MKRPSFAVPIHLIVHDFPVQTKQKYRAGLYLPNGQA